MKKAAVSASFGLSLAASGALAIDWTVKTQLAEYVGAGTNYLDTGSVMLSTSSLSLDAIGR